LDPTRRQSHDGYCVCYDHPTSAVFDPPGSYPAVWFKARAVIGRRSRTRLRKILVACAALAFVTSVPAQSSVPPADLSFDQLRSQAESARQAGDLGHASELYAQAVRVNPSWPDGWWYLGQLR